MTVYELHIEELFCSAITRIDVIGGAAGKELYYLNSCSLPMKIQMIIV